MGKLLFATTSQRKLREARAACQDFGIQFEPIQLDIVEIQSHDPMAIAKHKAAEAFRLAGKPVVITDNSWSIPALGGFPGGYMHDVSEWFKPQDFINLMADKTDRRFSYTETIIYTDAAQTKQFSEMYWGVIAKSPRGQGFSIDQIAEFNGRTIAEYHSQGRTSHDPKEYVWYQFGEWFSKLVN